MFVTENRKNRTYRVGNRSKGKTPFNVCYSVPFPGSKRASQLSLNLNGKRLNLTGRQVNVLRRVLRAADDVSAVS